MSDTSDNADIDTLLHISEVIVSREKEDFNQSKIDKAWERFKNDYLPSASGESLYDDPECDDNELNFRETSPFKKKRSTRTLMRVALVAAILAVLITIGSITASAFGNNLLGKVAEWTGAVFHFETASYNENELI